MNRSSRTASSTLVALLAACVATAPPPLPENRAPAADRAEPEPRDPRIKTVFAMFKDASGLPIGTEVKIAGLRVGEVSAIAIEQHARCGRCARVEMTIRGDLELYVSAAVFRRATATLGAFYLEIDPGNAPETDLETGRIHHGGEIEQVIERP